MDDVVGAALLEVEDFHVSVSPIIWIYKVGVSKVFYDQVGGGMGVEQVDASVDIDARGGCLEIADRPAFGSGRHLGVWADVNHDWWNVV